MSEDESTVTVEVQTLDSAKRGQVLFSGVFEFYKKFPCYQGDVISLGVIENGTPKGLPSVIILSKVKMKSPEGYESEFVFCSELTGQNFIIASQALNNHVSKMIRDKNPNAKDLI